MIKVAACDQNRSWYNAYSLLSVGSAGSILAIGGAHKQTSRGAA